MDPPLEWLLPHWKLAYSINNADTLVSGRRR